MPQLHQSFFPDSIPEPFIRRMKQSEDFVPEEFVSKQGMKLTNDTSFSNAAMKEHFFKGYEPHKGDMMQHFTPLKQEPNFYPIIILIVAILPLIVAKVLYFRALSQLYESLFSMIKFRLWLRDTGSLLKRLFLFTTPAHALVLALSLDFLIQKMSTNTYEFSFVTYIGVLALLVSFYIVRMLLMRISAAIFKSKTSTEEQNRNILIHNAVLVQIMIVLLPFCIYFPMGGLHFVLLFVILATEFSRIVKGIISAISLKEYGAFYFFLYFCTVEILPALILLKAGTMLAANY
jgi:hypothetical protein